MLAGADHHADIICDWCCEKRYSGRTYTGILFQFPGMLMMSLAGASAADVLVNPAGWLRGLSVGLSAAGMTSDLCNDRPCEGSVQRSNDQRAMLDVCLNRLQLPVKLDISSPDCHRWISHTIRQTRR